MKQLKYLGENSESFTISKTEVEGNETMWFISVEFKEDAGFKIDGFRTAGYYSIEDALETAVEDVEKEIKLISQET